MSKHFYVVWGLLSLLTLAGAACSRNAPQASSNNTSANGAVVISMTDDSFSPSQITIAKGATVTFVNNGSQPHWPASAPHPTHTNYPEFDPKEGINPGDSWSFSFDKVGSWGFHDHLNTQHFGKVTVTE